jgi:hypothetical protein
MKKGTRTGEDWIRNKLVNLTFPSQLISQLIYSLEEQLK